ncbi:ecdysteroid-phosphate phosphatase-like [Sycon ciliatum]|uniref:ecdysteroid-phosphate phosphatase-like n=1 Tax=Sycon ciliatum TaxID=27933 RepID=UPI0020A9B133|eukprot:scpid27541/ scgid23044/ Ubiquitin-associated and SH3 domain-containing protein B; Cbl-interacting protein p70; Suppressor of T-cell receptor signaling 1; T-cell ubiquitin ligand 2; Tyrosine-protein phosphatase STS1/TULA2
MATAHPVAPTATRPRNRASTIRQASDALAVLVEMGFPKNRAEKALAATGAQGVQAAADWILAHVFDPDLDKPIAREYVLYASPGGELGSQLEDLWAESLAQCGRNGAHKSFPHITLCQFFSGEDSKLPQVMRAVATCVQGMGEPPEKFDLSFYSSGSYIGLFLEDQPATKWLKTIVQRIAGELPKVGVKMEPHKKQLHMTLAYQFHSDQQKTLETLCRKVKPDAPGKWELRLYSRDPRVGSAEVYRVLYSLNPRNDDELELNEDDFMLLPAGDKAVAESEGWYVGTSFMTGVTGVFPGNYVEKCAETECWTMHRSWRIAREVETREEPRTVGHKPRSRPSIHPDPDPSKKDFDPANGYAQIQKQPKAKPVGPRLVIMIRHAERVDITFGHQWLQYSFDKDNSYHRRNLNMPKTVPIRKGGAASFKGDTPITEVGMVQARLTGEAMSEQEIPINHIYSSPALRCVQTADAILKGMGETKRKIRIEHGLFEWLAWCRDGIPTFMTAEEMAASGLQVDTSYKAIMHISQMNAKEKPEDYYRRSHKVTQQLLSKGREEGGGHTLLIGHAGTLDACSRQMTGSVPRSAQELTSLVQKVPYCGVAAMEENGSGAQATWQLVCPPFPTLTHAPNPRYDWRSLRQE